jgi:hypothetical protein
MAWVKQKKYPGSNMNRWVLNANVFIEKFDDNRSTYNPYKLHKNGEFVLFWPLRKGWEKARENSLATTGGYGKNLPGGLDDAMSYGER